MRARVLLVALVLLLTGCAGSTPAGKKPTFGDGGGGTTTIDPSDLAAAKQRAGIEDCPTAEATSPVEQGLPDLTLDCLGGGDPVRLSGLAGTPTVINLWASWCGPCREELPLLAKAHEEYGDRLRVIGVDFADSAPDAALELARLSGVTYPLLSDPDSTTKSPLKVVGLPQTVFVDQQGRMVATERIAFRSYAELTAAIDRHLGVAP
ncbi:TlpA family protein disulfide reductase [Aeromicrobium sp. A1-2]|uniref:TlpA family protein disulfide reductase n=1 Tax=Aeromicrobium sp. A1-2 TaxID=2107713 RepID=UPI000E54F894|nr:TlpA disulfide reductase family protein [Aeromicrobium sp. A1-2]AXT86242.1 TlpA family protein disulfide reductase [Aeromicrobium sp. A1-2]